MRRVFVEWEGTADREVRIRRIAYRLGTRVMPWDPLAELDMGRAFTTWTTIRYHRWWRAVGVDEEDILPVPEEEGRLPMPTRPVPTLTDEVATRPVPALTAEVATGPMPSAAVLTTPVRAADAIPIAQVFVDSRPHQPPPPTSAPPGWHGPWPPPLPVTDRPPPPPTVPPGWHGPWPPPQGWHGFWPPTTGWHGLQPPPVMAPPGWVGFWPPQPPAARPLGNIPPPPTTPAPQQTQAASSVDPY